MIRENSVAIHVSKMPGSMGFLGTRWVRGGKEATGLSHRYVVGLSEMRRRPMQCRPSRGVAAEGHTASSANGPMSIAGTAATSLWCACRLIGVFAREIKPVEAIFDEIIDEAVLARQRISRAMCSSKRSGLGSPCRARRSTRADALADEACV
jgi:hypothetical protein